MASHGTSSSCSECGAPLPSGDCRQSLHELLALEAQVPGGPGELPHFFTVAAYNLQHPSVFEPDVILGLRESLVDALAGRVDIDDLRRRARYGAEGNKRVLRRNDSSAAM